MNSVLVVCIGNICRSPMAAGLLARYLPNLTVRSAGIGALIGASADPVAQALMAQKGIDISGHIAQQINRLMCRQADVILVMDREQRRYIEGTYPFTKGKVFLISESLNQDVPDPYRKDENAFRYSLYLIEQGADAWINRIQKITKQERLNT